jgi:Uma2 family endonuclease
MRTVVLGERPPELEAFLARRRALGLDLRDEVWEGVYHVAPYAHSDHGIVQHQLSLVLGARARLHGLVGTSSFNLGTPNDFRVPDGGFHRSRPGLLYVPTAVVVVEVLSPDDETYEKFGFYATCGVEEILVAHPQERRVRCYDLRQEPAVETPHSRCLEVSMAAVESDVDWP